MKDEIDIPPEYCIELIEGEVEDEPQEELEPVPSSAKKRILQVTNSHQFEIMLSFMETHKELVTSVSRVSGGKQTVNALWSELTEQLNLVGPPARSDLDWKKVWSDLKNTMKKKLRRESRERGINCGDVRQFNLRSFDERLVNLTGMLSNVYTTQSADDDPLECVDEEIESETEDSIASFSDQLRQRKASKRKPSAKPSTSTKKSKLTQKRFLPLSVSSDSDSMLLSELTTQRQMTKRFYDRVTNILADIKRSNNQRLQIEQERLKIEKERWEMEKMKYKNLQ